MNRAELKQLSMDRVGDAEILLANGRWAAAYYLLGYAVETALKACILKFVEETGVIFTDKKFAEKCWSHRFNELLKQANLEPTHGRDIAVNAPFDSHWSIASLWTEVSRYHQKTEADARNLYDAITNDPDGVLPWITKHW
jgi:hypothetical protein